MGDATNYLAAGIREAIERIEAALKSGVNLSNEFSLKGELLNKQGQLAEASLEEMHFDKEKKEDKARQTSAVSYLVEQETKLNAQEKERYGNFLAMQYFTKQNLNDVGVFYRDSWDKLSENGKEEMDKRVAEGIRRGEFTVEEMPESMKQRLSGRLEKHGVDTGSIQSTADRESTKSSLHAEKSASSEADSRDVEHVQKKGTNEAKEEKKATDELALGEVTTPVNPINLRSSAGSSRSPS